MEIFNNLLLNKLKSINGCSNPPTQLLQHVHTWQQTLQSLNIDNTKQKSDPETEDDSNSEYQHAAVKEDNKINQQFNSYSKSTLSTNDSTDTDPFA